MYVNSLKEEKTWSRLTVSYSRMQIIFVYRKAIFLTWTWFWTRHLSRQPIKINKLNFKDVRANCFCASLLRTKFTCHVVHWACALSSKVNNNRANVIVVTLRGFNDLGHSVTPIFLSMGHFLYRFSKFCKKMKIYWVEVLVCCKTLHQIPFIWPLGLTVRQFQMPL